MNGHLKTARQVTGSMAAWANERESWFVLLALPMLLLPEYLAPLLPAAGVILLFVVACRLFCRRAIHISGQLDIPLLIILVMLSISVWVSSDPQLSMAKFSTIIGVLALFWSLATSLRRWQEVRTAGIMLALSSLGVVALALIGTEWPPSKVFYLSWFYNLLPSLISGVPRSIRGGFHPNEVGSALAMLAPLVFGVTMLVWAQAHGSTRVTIADLLPSTVRGYLPDMLKGRRPLLAALVLSLMITLFAFLLTQSRGALVGLLAGLVFMLALHDRRVVLVILVLVVVTTVADIGGVRGRLSRLLNSATQSSGQTGHDRLTSLLEAANQWSRVGSGSTSTAAGRAEMWRNALEAMSDYPLTGIGLYTFPAVSWANYVYDVVSPSFQMNHAHNTYLETGVDLGIPGLLAFLFIVAVVMIKGLRLATQGATPDIRWLAAGLIGGLTANLVHGLVDSALPMGHKPGVIWWAMAALLIATDRVVAGQLPVHCAIGDALKAERLTRMRLPRHDRLLVLACAVVAALALATVALLPVVCLNLGALALDQARLRPDLSAEQRAACLDRAEELLKQALPWKAATVNLRLGLVENERGHIEAARAYWSQTPLALSYLLAQGNRYDKLGLHSQAEPWFEHAVAVAPSSSSAWYHSGLMARDKGHLSEALAALRKALDLDNFRYPATERGETYAALASVMGAQGHWAEAVALYQQAETVSSLFLQQADVAWALYQRDGNADAAEDYLRQSIRQMPQQVEPYVALIDMLHVVGHDDEAIELGKKTVLQFPDEIAPLLALGRVYMAQRAYPQAEAMFRQAVTLRPSLPEAYVWLGRLAMEQQQPRGAITTFTEAIRLSPEQADYYTLLGDAYQAAGDTANAAESYRKALDLDPQNAAAQRGLDNLP